LITARLPGRRVRQQRPAPAEQIRGTANEIQNNSLNNKEVHTMTYKGYEIDGTIFTSKTEIDNFLKRKAIESYKTAVKAFCEHTDMEHSLYADQKAEYLNTQFRMDWDEIEAIELEAMAA